MMRHKHVVVASFLLLGLLGGCGGRNFDMLSALGPMNAGAEPLGDTTATRLYLTIVEGLIDQGRYRAALGYLDQYAVAEKKTPRYTALRGEALLGVERYDEAAATFTELTGTGLAAAGHNGLGRVAAARERWPEAESHFAQAVTERPSNADYLNNLGFAELHLSDDMLSKAEFNLRQAHEIEPNSASIRNNLVLALMMAGKDGEARALLEHIAVPRERVAVQKFASDWVLAQSKSGTE